jgi:flagellar protein FlgJ
MGVPLQSISLMPLPLSMDAKGFPVQALQQALSLQPSLGSAAAGQAMGLPSSGPSLPLDLKPSALNPLKGPALHSDGELKKVSKNFESIFMRMLFKEMRNSVQKSDVFGSSRAMEFFENMQDEQLSESLASAGGLGIGNMIYQKLKASTVPHLKTFS